MRSPHIRIVFTTCVALNLLSAGCIGTVDGGGSGYEQEENPASAYDPSTDGTDDGGASDPGNASGGGSGEGALDAGSPPPSGNTPPPVGNADAAVPAPTRDAGQTPPPPPPPPPPPSGDPEAASIARGAAIYPSMCGGCHGNQGQGGRGGPSLTDDVPFDDLATTIELTMPRGNPSACERECAEDVARFILATFVN